MEAAADAPRVETPPRHTPPPTPTSAEGSEAGERPDEQQGDSPGDADVRPRSTVAHDFGGDTAGSALASPSPQAAPQERSGAFQDPLFLCEERHDASEAVTSLVALQDTLISKWRMKDRMKTMSVALLLCLNVGVDPPDVLKISPCARLECWINPLAMQPQKALEAIGKALQAQYDRWQPRARYKMQLDPTVDDVKKLCITCRKNAKSERVLLHYNGHGVPRPTVNGEIWVFNKSYTQYIPLSVYDVQTWTGTPSIYVLDCSAAGLIVNAFCKFAKQRQANGAADEVSPSHDAAASPGDEDGAVASPMRECILLAACGADELLPQSADLPADVFSACLTTPIKMALRWFCMRSPLKGDGVTLDLIDKIPGQQNNRKTPLGELNWIFTAITDTIAWNVLPRQLFQRLFRQDLLVASLFRNFLLAERILRANNCTPISCPRLPPTYQHPIWQAWDLAVEMCLLQMPALVSGNENVEFQPSTFFTEQLTAFEVWLEHGSERRSPPEQLPIVLQVLLSQSHRLRALVLLGRFLDMGPWAVDLALSVGIFPYVLKLLQTTAVDLRHILVFIWTKILSLDRSCQLDLVKDGGHLYFIRFLDSPDVDGDQRAMAAFVLASVADNHPKGQAACLSSGLLGICLQHLPEAAAPGVSPHLLRWLCVCLTKLWEGFPAAQAEAFRVRAPDTLGPLLSRPSPEVRAAAVAALAALISTPHADAGPVEGQLSETDKAVAERAVACQLLQTCLDGSPMVRVETAVGLARFARAHRVMFTAEAHTWLRGKGGSSHNSAASTPPSPPVGTGSQQHAGRSSHDGDAHTAITGTPGSARDTLAGGRASSSSPARPGAAEGTPRSPFGAPGVERAASLSGSLSGVHARSPSGPFEPSFGAAQTASPSGSAELAGSAGSSAFATADAARVGGGLYGHVLEAMVMLATDPSPRVAKVGREALTASGIDIRTAAVRPSQGNSVLPRSRSAAAFSRDQPGAPRTPIARAASFSARIGSIASWATGSPTTTGTPSRPPPSPARPASGHARLPSWESFGSSLHDRQASTTVGVSFNAMQTQDGELVAPLPSSPFFALSCHYFSRPLLEPLRDPAQPGGFDEEHDVILHAPWCRPLDTTKRTERRRLAAELAQQALHAPTKLSTDPLVTLDTEGQTPTAIVFHPLAPLLFTANAAGLITCWNYEDVTVMHSFRGGTCRVSKLELINELDDPLLMVATTDGMVRIWRNPSTKGETVLATAWRTMPSSLDSVRAVPDPGKPAAHACWQHASGCLYTVGGLQPCPVLRVWDVVRELCVDSVAMLSPAGNSARQAAAPVTCLSNAVGALVMAGTAAGSVLSVDLRSPARLINVTTPHLAPVTGVQLQPGGTLNEVVTSSLRGELCFIDLRTNHEPHDVVQAFKGGLTSVCSHRYAPLIAAGSSERCVKVFDLAGRERTTLKYHNRTFGQRIGPVSTLAFHPLRATLASGSTDHTVTLWRPSGHGAS